MASEQRRVVAETAVHAKALADNLTNQGYVIEAQSPARWVLRKPRRRGDITMTIDISMPFDSPPPSAWGPPTGPPAQ